MSAAWQKKAGKNPKGGLNAKGRASYNKETGGNLKAPVKSGDNVVVLTVGRLVVVVDVSRLVVEDEVTS